MQRRRHLPFLRRRVSPHPESPVLYILNHASLVEMCYAGFIYLFEACNKLAEEITGPSLVISGD
jgi:hypothetical protein